LTQQLAVQLHIEPESLRRLMVFLLGLHDLGKFSRAFQEVLKLSLDGMATPQGDIFERQISRCIALGWADHVGR
jgi:CRISPR-associated endonuclease/helicase Cas3